MGTNFQSDLSIDNETINNEFESWKRKKKENDDVIAFKYQGIWSETYRVVFGATRIKKKQPAKRIQRERVINIIKIHQDMSQEA